MEYISKEEENMVNHFKHIGQDHLIRNLNDFKTEERQALVDQYLGLEKSYPGGIEAYIMRGRKLLQDSKNNVNPYEGFRPQVPIGETIQFENSQQIDRLESIGKQQIDQLCFVLVAGGLGERLGYKGIKVEIPMDLVSGKCFLEYYIEFILAFQKRGTQKDLQIPLAIMTSDDTYDLTVTLLESNNYFGMEKSQITIMKQEKVPTLMNNEAQFAQCPGSLLIETKPHGHGDVHQLIHQNKLHEKWLSLGKKWVFFFQDTNPLVFRSLLAVLGVSEEKNLEVNSITVPRKPGEAVGAICKLEHADGRNLTINVEYNQLGPLLQNTIGTEETDENGFSVFPGNINSLVFRLPEYATILDKTDGVIAEFINPKYADSTKTTFKSPTRLECMMQDYPKLLLNADKVGFTQIQREYSFAAVKNDIESASLKQKSGLSAECAGTCEQAIYELNANLLRLCGAQISQSESTQNFQGVEYNFGPKIILSPDFGVTLKEIKENIQGKVEISAESTLYIKENVKIGNLELDGQVIISQSSQDKNLEIKNKQYQQFVSLNEQGEDKNAEEYIKIRGYKLISEKEQQKSLKNMKNLEQQLSDDCKVSQKL